MSGTFLCPNTCGFAKVVALELARGIGSSVLKEKGESNTKYKARLKEDQYNQFNNHFKSDATEDKFYIDFLKFHKRLPGLRDAVGRWNSRKSEEKSKYLETFSLKNWQKLSLARKREHSLSNCKGCVVRYAEVQAFFPVKSMVLMGKAKLNPVFSAKNEAQKLSSKFLKDKQTAIKNTAKAIYDNVGPIFEKTFDMSFAEALSKVPGLNLQHKTINERRNERRNHYKHSKENIEKQMEATSFLRCYGGGQSLSAWQRSRLALSFETKASAKERREKLDLNEEPAKKRKKKNHTGDFNAMTWDKEALRAEVEANEDNHMVNWKQLATKYNICNKAGQLASNGGQVIKDWLISEGVNVTRFDTKRKHDCQAVVRRKKRKGPGGEISVPTEVNQDALKKQLREKIQLGVYTVGEMIVPQKYEKLVLTKNLEIEKVEFTTEGRKTSLEDIRNKMLSKHKQYMRGYSDSQYNEMGKEELKQRLAELNELKADISDNLDKMREKLQALQRTRHLLVWLDNSTVASHGYLVCLVTCLYDPAVFFTDAEYKLRTGKTINIQKKIEQPELHFIARCGSSDHELFLYSETRLSCIQSLQQQCTLDGVHYNDKLRFCHGDSPLRAFEAGQQKGGNYFCSTCGVHCDMTYELDHVLNHKLITLQDRQDSILQGAVARKHSIQLKAKPLRGLTREQLEQELSSRSIYEEGNKKTPTEKDEKTK